MSPAPSAQAGAQHHSREEPKGRTREREEGAFQPQVDKKRQKCLHKELNSQPMKKRRTTATTTPLTCTQPSKLVRQGGQQALEASVVLAEDDSPSLTALRAVTIYRIVFSEGQRGERNAQSPDEQATRHPSTAKNCPQLHTPLQAKPLSSVSSRNTSRDISSWSEDRYADSTQPVAAIPDCTKTSASRGDHQIQHHGGLCSGDMKLHPGVKVTAHHTAPQQLVNAVSSPGAEWQ